MNVCMSTFDRLARGKYLQKIMINPIIPALLWPIYCNGKQTIAKKCLTCKM